MRNVSPGWGLVPNGLFEETWTTRRTPWPSAAAMTLAVPRALISSKSSVRSGWMTPAVWTTSTRAGEAGEERVQPVGPADVAEDRLDAGEAGEGHQVLGVADEGADRPWSGVRAAVADEVVDQRPAQPAAGSRHDREVGWVDPIRA